DRGRAAEFYAGGRDQAGVLRRAVSPRGDALVDERLRGRAAGAADGGEAAAASCRGALLPRPDDAAARRWARGAGAVGTGRAGWADAGADSPAARRAAPVPRRSRWRHHRAAARRGAGSALRRRAEQPRAGPRPAWRGRRGRTTLDRPPRPP